MDNDFQREDQRVSSLEIPLAWTVASPQWRTRVCQPRGVVQAPPRWKVEKKMPMKTAWNTNANTLQKTMNLNKITHLGRAVLRFCSSAYPRSTWYILKTLRFLTICQKHVMTQTLNIANSTALLPALWPCIHPPHMVWGVRTLLHKATFYTEAFTQDFF